ncbi:MAG TPA: response regulator transcription factor [Pseudolabrys sp.]|nr:response regulator transcription factor [Pseudolabrys sp.]
MNGFSTQTTSVPGSNVTRLPDRISTLTPRRQTASRNAGPDAERPLVLIVDDDEAVRSALRELVLSVGIDARCFGSARELLDAGLPRRPGCLLLDVRMPGSSGLDLQSRLAANEDAPPIIFLTGHGDIPMAVTALKAGAVDFLTKPVRDQTLLDAVTAAIGVDIARRRKALLVKQHIERLATLTQRERQVFREVAQGRLNKQIAFDLGISEVTVKLHRCNVMRKMQAASIGELVRAWEALPADMREARAA